MRPHRCEPCDRGFLTTGALKKHNRTVHGVQDKIAEHVLSAVLSDSENEPSFEACTLSKQELRDIVTFCDGGARLIMDLALPT